MMRALHTEFYAVSRGEKFVTLFLGRLDISQKHLTYINAGHNPPLLKSGNEVVELKDGCIPLGIMDIEQMSTGSIRLHQNDILFLYTDGLTEQENPQGDMFGSEKLVEWLQHFEGKDPVAEVLMQYEQYRKGAPALDDISLMSVKLI
jgi:phosphoserine phosphatase RsbU/P